MTERTLVARGIGVAGPRGVLAWHNENKPIGDRKGIDHLEQEAGFDPLT